MYEQAVQSRPRKWGEAMDISTTIDLISLVLFAVGLGITIGKIKK